MDKCMIWAGEGGEACWWEANCGSFPPIWMGGKCLALPPHYGGAIYYPPIFRDPGGEIFCAPPSGFSWGGNFFMGGNSKWGEKGIYGLLHLCCCG